MAVSALRCAHGRYASSSRTRTRTTSTGILETLGIRSRSLDARIETIVVRLAKRTVQSVANAAAVRCPLICSRGVGVVARTIPSPAAHAATHARIFFCVDFQFNEP